MTLEAELFLSMGRLSKMFVHLKLVSFLSLHKGFEHVQVKKFDMKIIKKK